MNAPTPFLSALVLISSAFPAQVFRLGMVSQAPRQGVANSRRWIGQLVLPFLFTLVAGLAWYVAPVTGVLGGLPERNWYYIAGGLGVLAPGIEILVGVLIARFRRIPVARIGLHERWAAVSLAAVVGVVLTAAAEELVFRGVWLHVLEQSLGWPDAAAIGLTAVVYGFNHLYFGWLTVAQKVVTGVLFGVLFELSGYSLVIPIVAHVTQNLVVLLVMPLLTRRR